MHDHTTASICCPSLYTAERIKLMSESIGIYLKLLNLQVCKRGSCRLCVFVLCVSHQEGCLGVRNLHLVV